MIRTLQYRVRAKGKNLSLLLRNMSKENIAIYNAKRDGDALEFFLSPKGYVTLKSLDFGDTQFEVTKVGGKEFVLFWLLSHIGFLLGIVASVILYLAISSKIFYISISGLENTQKTQVMASLEAIDIKKFATMPSDMNLIEEHLLGEFDFSIVSAVRRGNALVINIKEELSDTREFEEIVAEYDMVIELIEVYSGTQNVKAGDIVRKGDVLVYPYMMVGENSANVEPKANIVATRFVSKTYNFLSEETKVERTGNTVVGLCEYYLGKYKLLETSSTHDFEFFEEEYEEVCVSYYFLPIKVKRKVVYEVGEVIINHDFESEREGIIDGLRAECLALSEGKEIADEKCDIIPMGFGYTINYHTCLKIYLQY